MAGIRYSRWNKDKWKFQIRKNSELTRESYSMNLAMFMTAVYKEIQKLEKKLEVFKHRYEMLEELMVELAEERDKEEEKLRKAGKFPVYHFPDENKAYWQNK